MTFALGDESFRSWGKFAAGLRRPSFTGGEWGGALGSGVVASGWRGHYKRTIAPDIQVQDVEGDCADGVWQPAGNLSTVGKV